MNHEVKKIIIDYLSRPRVNYGIMITDTWGSGKTYFWKNEIEDEVKKRQRFSPVYISANGLSTTEDLSRNLLLGILAQKNMTILGEKYGQYAESFMSLAKPIADNIKGLGDAAGSFFGVYSGIMEANLKTSGLLNFFNFSDRVVCIDDVERYCGNLKEFMGFCNNLLEHYQAHLVLIANEQKIQERDVFREIKEKVIGKTVWLHLNPTDIIRSILKNLKNAHRDFEAVYAFLYRNIACIVKLVSNEWLRNYRVVTMLLEDFAILYSKMDEMRDLGLTDAEKDRARRKLLYFMLAAGMEIHTQHVSEKDIKQLRDSASSVRLGELIAAVGGKTEKDAAKTQEFFKSFKKRYYTEMVPDRDFFPSTIDFLVKGVLHEEEFRREISLFHERELTVRDYVLSVGYWNMSDEMFEREVKGSLLNEISSGSIPIQFYRKLFLQYALFHDMGLLGTDGSMLEGKFLQGLIRIEEMGTQDPPGRDPADIFLYEQVQELSSESQQAFERVSKAIDQTVQYLRDHKKEDEANRFVDTMKSDFAEAMKLPFPSAENKYMDGPLFAGARSDTVYGILKQQENGRIIEFRNMLLNRRYYCTKEAERQDAPFLLQLAELIEQKTSFVHGKKLSETLLQRLAADIRNMYGQGLQTEENKES